MEPGSLAKKPPKVLPLAMLALFTTVMPPGLPQNHSRRCYMTDNQHPAAAERMPYLPQILPPHSLQQCSHPLPAGTHPQRQ
jgi:hypothetical protein